MSKKLTEMDSVVDLSKTVIYGVESQQPKSLIPADPIDVDVKINVGAAIGLATLDVDARLEVAQTPFMSVSVSVSARYLDSDQHGECVGIDSVSAETVEMPIDAQAGWWVEVAQIGEGQVTVTPPADGGVEIISSDGSRKTKGKGAVVRYLLIDNGIALLTGGLAPNEPLLAIYFDESNWYPLGPDDATYVDSESAQAESNDATRALHGWVPAFQYLGSRFLAQFSFALVDPVTGYVLEYSSAVEFTTLVIEEHRYLYGPPSTVTAGKTDTDLGWTLTTGVNGAGVAADYAIDPAPDFSTIDLVAAIVGTAHFAVAGARAISTTVYGRFSLS